MSLNGLVGRLKQRIRREDFDPTWLGVLVNPSFLMRRGLRNAVSRHAARMHGRMVDFGCGRKPYRDLFQVDEYIGVDVRISGHPDQDKHVDVYYEGFHIPLPSSSVDCILSSEVFEHVFELEKILPELHRLLRPGGVLLLTCPFCWGEHEVPYDYARYTRFALRHRLSEAGFEIVVEEKEGPFLDALFQMAIVYSVEWLTPKAQPFQRLFRWGWATLFNGCALLFGAVFKPRWNFYLSNVVLVRKPEVSVATPPGSERARIP